MTNIKYVTSNSQLDNMFRK